MDIIVEIIKITLPILIIAILVYFLNNKLIHQLVHSSHNQKNTKVKKEVLVLRLQAYERLILLMERITPDNLLMRIETSGMNINEFHLELLSVIRAEFDHNISQQLYVSDHVWHEVNTAKEEVTKIINVTFHQIEEASILAMSRKIVEAHLKSNMPTYKAISAIKEEVRQLF